METGIFCSVLVLCSLASVAFLVLGLATPAWMRNHMEIRSVPQTPAENNPLGQIMANLPKMTIDTEQDYGLWKILLCTKIPPADDYTCNSTTYGDLEKESRSTKVSQVTGSAGQVAVSDMLDNLRTVRMFAITGVVAAALGVLMTCDFLRRSAEKTPIAIGAITACWWALAFLMAIIAVAMQAQYNVTVRNGFRIFNAIPNIPMKSHLFFPWSIMLYGVGGIFAALAAMLVLVRTVCIRREFGRGTVKWTRLTNEAEVDLRPDVIDPPPYYDEKGAPRGHTAASHY